VWHWVATFAGKNLGLALCIPPYLEVVTLGDLVMDSLAFVQELGATVVAAVESAAFGDTWTSIIHSGPWAACRLRCRLNPEDSELRTQVEEQEHSWWRPVGRNCRDKRFVFPGPAAMAAPWYIGMTVAGHVETVDAVDVGGIFGLHEVAAMVEGRHIEEEHCELRSYWPRVVMVRMRCWDDEGFECLDSDDHEGGEYCRQVVCSDKMGPFFR